MLAAAATKGQVLIKNAISRHLDPVIEKLEEAGAVVGTSGGTIFVNGSRDLRSIDVDTRPYPGFPTDLQSFAAVLLTQSRGTGTITENVFADRFRYLEELKRLGARIKVNKKSAIINGVSRLSACSLQATDIRAGAACIIAGLAARGITEINGVHHIDRGYEGMENKLRHLGADLVRVNEKTRKCLQWHGMNEMDSISDRCRL